MIARTVFGAGLIMMAMTAACQAQSINIDFGDGSGSPKPEYSATGLPGVWNTLVGPIATPTALFDLDGEPTGATVIVDLGFDTLAGLPIAHPELGEHRVLLDDGLLGAHGPGISIFLRFDGLEPGQYRMIMYAWYFPAEAFGQVWFVEGHRFVHTVGGPWPGEPTVGVTHMVHGLDVNDGVIEVEIVGDGPGAFFNGDIYINGIQLWMVEPGCAADLDGDEFVGPSDLIALLGAWGSDPNGPPDLDGDGNVGTTDLVMLLGAWGECPSGADAIDCGAKGFGDCYTAHDTPGCNDPACCEALCEADPYCCEQQWDALCVGIANVLEIECANGVHPNCGAHNSESCFVGHLFQGCEDVECCNAVCHNDQFCCNYAWDDLCAEQANKLCKR